MKKNVFWTYLLASTLGAISIVLPFFFLPDIKQYDSPLFSIIRTAIEGISYWSFGLLFLSGFVIKVFSKVSSLKLGLATMALFPIMAILEMIVDPTSHNLFPFEFIYYAILSLPAIAGAYISQGIFKNRGNN